MDLPALKDPRGRLARLARQDRLGLRVRQDLPVPPDRLALRVPLP